MSVRSLLNKFLFPSPTGPQIGTSTPEVRAEPLINLRQSTIPLGLYCQGTTFLKAIERTDALVKLLKEATSVTIDRVAGHIDIDLPSGRIQGDLLQAVSEIYLKRRGGSKLFLTPRSPLRESMTAEHLGKVEEMLKRAVSAGTLLSHSGIISVTGATRPYSRLGQGRYIQLPPTIQHGDYQFFVPGAERAATVQLLANLAGDSHIVLPSIVLNGAKPNASSNVSISPLWQFAALGGEISAQLQRQQPLQRCHSLLFNWGPFLSMERFDLRQTIYGLAHALGLTVNHLGAASPMEAGRFAVTAPEAAGGLLVQVGAPDGSGRQELTVGWAEQLEDTGNLGG